MTNELRPINFGINKFCVPAVMSALTGRSTDECAAVITSINGRQEIKAVNVPDIIKAFKKLRFDIVEQTSQARSLYGVLQRLAASEGLYLILVPHHIVAIRIENGQIEIVDNASREPLDARASARLTQSVDKVFKITPKPQPVFIGTSIICEKDPYLNRLSIKRVSRYSNPDDDIACSLGYLVYTDEDELRMIVSALNDRVLLDMVKGEEK